MRSAHRTPPAGGAYSRRFTAYTGIFFDEFDSNSAWIRARATITLPPLDGVRGLVLTGEFRPHPAARGLETAAPGLVAAVNGRPAGALSALLPGPWELRLSLPASDHATLTLDLTGIAFTNTLAWLGRVTGLAPLQRFRAQNKNRQLRLLRLTTLDGEIVYDFSLRHAPYSTAYARAHAKLGVNIVGFLTAELGVGESARCMVRAADAAGIPSALVPLKLNCKNRLGDQTYAARLQDENPHDVNIVHVDPPASRDLDHHHGKGFRAGKYNIAYFAWELPEFPDAWTSAFDYFDEIWTPSDFTTQAIVKKSPLPVLTMPHSIVLPRPTESAAALRTRLGLPADPFLFLTLFDLNSYAERKNPHAVIAAFRASGLATSPVVGPDLRAGRSGAALRTRLGLPPEKFLFLTLFDLNSYAERKNPHAVLTAFRLAFFSSARSGGFPTADAASPALVVKVQNVTGNEADFAALRASVADLPGTILLTETLSRADITALEAACDCFVSLHRTEGFGLAVAEAMFLGKPVISTDWSATAEFVNATNGCPVRAPLITLERHHGPYAKGSTWADPDPTHAAEHMRRLFADPALCATLGAAARSTIETHFSPAAIGTRYRRRLESIATF